MRRALIDGLVAAALSIAAMVIGSCAGDAAAHTPTSVQPKPGAPHG